MLPRYFLELILAEALFLLQRNTHLRLALIIEVDGLLAASGWVGNVQLVRVEGEERSPSVKLLRWTLEEETTTCWVEGGVALKSVESCGMNPKRFALVLPQLSCAVLDQVSKAGFHSVLVQISGKSPALLPQLILRIEC